MENDENLRREAVNMYLQQVSIKEISSHLGKTRQWVHKWIRVYQKSRDPDWFRSKSTAPKTHPGKTSHRIEELVISIRKRMQDNIYAQKGAISILYEFERLGIVPPSISTINRILNRNNLIKQSNVKRTKQTEYPDYFLGVQQMDLIGPKYLKGGCKFYLYSIIDTENHFAGVYPIKDKSAQSIVPCLADFWKIHSFPDFLQMDNELSFRGSNRHPRGLGMLLRFAISNRVCPMFIPPAEPWRNGIVEKFNDNVLKYFYSKQTFSCFEDIEDKAKQFSEFHNNNHRYSSQGNRTPIQMKEINPEFIFRLEKEIDLNNKIHIEEGRIIFIRFIRSNLKLTILNTEFYLKPELKYSYVVAEIVIEKHVLVVSQNSTIHHIFEFAMPVS